MKKHVLIAALWFYSIWYAAALLGAQSFAPVFGVVAAVTVVGALNLRSTKTQTQTA